MNMRWLGYRVHPTWHFTVLCLAVVVGLGISTADWAQVFADPLWMVVGLVTLPIVFWKQLRWMLVVAALAGMVAGISRGAHDVAARTVYDVAIGQAVIMQGVVYEDTDRDKNGGLTLRLADVRVGEHELPAQVWVSLRGEYDVRRSDVVTIEGSLSEGFGSFAASMYRAEIIEIVRPQPGDVALEVRESFGEKVRLGISDPAASLGMGYLTGQRRSLPEELDDALRVAGLTHVVVASGYNLTILVRFMRRLLSKHSRYLTAFGSTLLIGSFIAVTGMSPSMSRAGLVAGLALGAWYIGRKFHPVTLLAFAAAVTGLAEPSYVWGNLGWQLSFAAFAGVMILAPLAQNYFFGDSKPGNIRQILGETTAAQIVTAPLLLYSFGYISNVALIANLFVLPLIPFAMLLTFTTGLAGYILPWAVGVIALPAQWLLNYMVWVAMTTASQPWALAEFSMPLWGVGFSFAVIIAACWYMQRATGYRLRDGSIIE